MDNVYYVQHAFLSIVLPASYESLKIMITQVDPGCDMLVPVKWTLTWFILVVKLYLEWANRQASGTLTG